MYFIPRWKSMCLRRKVNSRCPCWFLAVILMCNGGTLTWLLYTKLYNLELERRFITLSPTIFQVFCFFIERFRFYFFVAWQWKRSIVFQVWIPRYFLEKYENNRHVKNYIVNLFSLKLEVLVSLQEFVKIKEGVKLPGGLIVYFSWGYWSIVVWLTSDRKREKSKNSEISSFHRSVTIAIGKELSKT